MREIEVIKPLKIGWIGLDRENIKLGMRLFYDSNKDDVAIIKDDLIVMKDGTEIRALHDSTATKSFLGYNPDQIIIADDYRWGLKVYKKSFIDYVKLVLLAQSCVPAEFQVMEFEY